MSDRKPKLVESSAGVFLALNQSSMERLCPESGQGTAPGMQEEDSLTCEVVRLCWQCQRRLMESTGCVEMRCVCGAITCYWCGGHIEEHRHVCEPGLPPAAVEAVYRYMQATSKCLRMRYPTLCCNDTPSPQHY